MRNFREPRKSEVQLRRIPIPRTRVNRDAFFGTARPGPREPRLSLPELPPRVRGRFVLRFFTTHIGLRAVHWQFSHLCISASAYLGAATRLRVDWALGVSAFA